MRNGQAASTNAKADTVRHRLKRETNSSNITCSPIAPRSSHGQAGDSLVGELQLVGRSGRNEQSANLFGFQVLIHGMWGSPSHLASAARVIEEVKGSEDQLVDAGAPDLHVLVAETNAEDHTYDGIDNGGERVAQEASRLT